MCLGISFPTSDSTYYQLMWLNTTRGSYGTSSFITNKFKLHYQISHLTSPCMMGRLKSWSSGKDIRELCPWTMMERTLSCTVNNWHGSKTPRWSLDSYFSIKETYTIFSRPHSRTESEDSQESSRHRKLQRVKNIFPKLCDQADHCKHRLLLSKMTEQDFLIPWYTFIFFLCLLLILLIIILWYPLLTE